MRTRLNNIFATFVAITFMVFHIFEQHTFLQNSPHLKAFFATKGE